MRVVGQLILIEGKEHNITEIESAVEEGASAYKRKFPRVEDLLVYMNGKTRSEWEVNGSVGGLEAYQDDDIPVGYIWVIDAKDKQSFSPKKIN